MQVHGGACNTGHYPWAPQNCFYSHLNTQVRAHTRTHTRTRTKHKHTRMQQPPTIASKLLEDHRIATNDKLGTVRRMATGECSIN
jgi:hypothetical protein